MRTSFGVIAGLAIMCMLAVSPLAVSGKHIAHLEVTIAPGTTYQDLQNMTKGEIASCAWMTDHQVRFYLTDPQGETIRQSNGTIGQAIVDVTSAGTYTFNWQNSGTVPVELQFDKGFVHPEQTSMVWIAASAILIAIIALMVALIVYLAAKNKPKT